MSERLHRDPQRIRVRPGVYAPREAFEALAPWDRYLVRIHAFLLAHPDAILAGVSACAVRSLPILGRPSLIHVFDPRRTTSTRFGDVVVHTSLDGRIVEEHDAIRTTRMAETVLDTVRTLTPAAGVALVDAAIRAHGAPVLADLGDLADVQVSSRGRARIRLVLPLASGESESVGESVSRVAIGWLGFEAPRLQVRFAHERGVDRVDFGWGSVRALGEFDGYGKYVDDPSETAARKVIAEKERENRLRRRCRAFDRWDWHDLMAIEPLEQRLVAMAVPRPGPVRRALLAGIRPSCF